MGRKKREDGKWKCRYNCGVKPYGSKSGRAAHEKTVHGGLWTSKPKPEDDKMGPISALSTNSSTTPSLTNISVQEFVLMKEPKTKTKEVEKDTCGACGATVAVDSKFCPSCGVEFE